MDSSLDLCISCGAVVFNNSAYCSRECHSLDAAPSSRAFFTPAPLQSSQQWASSSSSSSHRQHRDSSALPSPSTPSSSKWPGNDRAGIESWAKGVWGGKPIDENEQDDSNSDVLSLLSSGSRTKTSIGTRRRRLSPVSSFNPAPQLLLTAQQLAAPALSGLAPLSRSDASFTDDDGASLLTPSSTSSASIPIPFVKSSQHQHPTNTIASKVRAWVMPSSSSRKQQPQIVDDATDPWISSPPYGESYAQDILTIRKRAPVQPERGRALLRAEW